MAYDRTKIRQIAIYVDAKFFRKMEKEAEVRNRKIGPTALEILREFFEQKDAREAKYYEQKDAEEAREKLADFRRGEKAHV